MQASHWIKLSEKAGWRVAKVTASSIYLRCQCVGCPGHVSAPLGGLGQPPGPCNRDHDNRHARPVYDQYRELVHALRRRRLLLGLDQADLCAACGLADGHIAKLESFKKTASPPTLFYWASALGLQLALAPQELPQATLRAIDNRKGRPYARNQARFKHTAGHKRAS
ncbi:MAG: helix-turn-helix transcriptional regulator [Vannielia sp.]|uniref:helix-turn-helix domain-containing protein n=1 Tax=Vannielia sp. TaxID=2813045 RepID=UPI003B8D756E